jgi:hypothetical protein
VKTTNLSQVTDQLYPDIFVRKFELSETLPGFNEGCAGIVNPVQDVEI